VGSLQLSPQVFAILAALVERYCGLHYGVQDAQLFGAKVEERVLERGFESFLDYYYFLRYDPEGPREIAALVETLLVHETYFFREQAQLEAVVSECLLPRIERGRRVRVWCAAASSGEEPLSLAMLLAERGLLAHAEIVASDVSARIVAQARAGIFNRRALRSRPGGFGAWLRVEGDTAIVDSNVRDAVSWRCVNLIAPSEFARLGHFDAILCRNVLIYFRGETIRRTVDALVERLTPDGAIVVGAAESLLRVGTRLRCEERRGVFFYERMDGRGAA
jgi:chemotaxis protein methyltransferase CheR